MTEPTPIIKLWKVKPRLCCSSGSISTTKARKGSMEMLMDASKTHSKPAAIHKGRTLGHEKQRHRSKQGPHQEIGAAAAERRPGAVRPISNHGLNQQSRSWAPRARAWEFYRLPLRGICKWDSCWPFGGTSQTGSPKSQNSCSKFARNSIWALSRWSSVQGSEAGSALIPSIQSRWLMKHPCLLFFQWQDPLIIEGLFSKVAFIEGRI